MPILLFFRRSIGVGLRKHSVYGFGLEQVAPQKREAVGGAKLAVCAQPLTPQTYAAAVSTLPRVSTFHRVCAFVRSLSRWLSFDCFASQTLRPTNPSAHSMLAFLCFIPAVCRAVLIAVRRIGHWVPAGAS